MLRLLNYLNHRLQRALVEYNVQRAATVKGPIRCGPNALVYNHGPRENIRLGTGVILDGILECYERGSLEIGENSYVGHSRIFASKRVKVGKGVFISDFVVVFDSNLHPLNGKKRFHDLIEWQSGKFPDVYSNIPAEPVLVEDYSWIGALTVIGKGVTVGEGAVVGAGSVVTKDIPPYTVAVGNPAKVIRELRADES